MPISWCPLAPLTSHAPLVDTVSPTSPICCPRHSEANHSLGRQLLQRSSFGTSADLSRWEISRSCRPAMVTWTHFIFSPFHPPTPVEVCGVGVWVVLCERDSWGRAVLVKITVTCLAASSLMSPGLS